MKDQNVKKIGYKIGYLLGLTICSCSIVAIIALTIKLITWLF